MLVGNASAPHQLRLVITFPAYSRALIGARYVWGTLDYTPLRDRGSFFAERGAREMLKERGTFIRLSGRGLFDRGSSRFGHRLRRPLL